MFKVFEYQKVIEKVTYGTLIWCMKWNIFLWVRNTDSPSQPIFITEEEVDTVCMCFKNIYYWKYNLIANHL